MKNICFMILLWRTYPEQIPYSGAGRKVSAIQSSYITDSVFLRC